MKAVLALIAQTLREQLSNRGYQLLIVFGGFLVYASLLFGVMAVDQKLRILHDFGLALIELFALATAVYGAATTILREMETKTIYLILTRPISKGGYLVGRFLGLLGATGIAVAAMGALHLVLLRSMGWPFSPVYFLLLGGCFLKVAIVAALASLLALFSTSVVTALNITIVLWILGHFMSEAKFVISKAPGPAAGLLKLLLYVIPNLQVLNFKDRFEAPRALEALPVLLGGGYAVAYASVCLGLGLVLFRRKEF